MWFLKMLGSNILYIIWFTLYFRIAWIIFGGDLQGFIFTSIVYGSSVIIALSPVGEVLLRAIENCREPQTEKEKAYLLPIFEEVYENAREIDPGINKGIKIYIIDAMYVNAYAIGRKTIAVTRGALETFTEDELKGILAHELGHMSYGHTKALLLSIIGNLFFSIIVWVFRTVLNIMQGLTAIFAHVNVIALGFMIVAFIAKLMVEISSFLFINLSQMILASNSRANEIQADKYAYDIGYGDELTNSLYLLQKITMNTKMGLIAKTKASHSHLGYRIGQLEKLEDEVIAEE